MCRLAVVFRRPLHEIGAWPAADLAVLGAYLARRPPPEERIELAIASLHAAYHNAHKRDEAPLVVPTDFLVHSDPWPEPVEATAGRYSKLDLEIMRSLK